MLGFWINYAVNQTISKETKTQWIVPLGLQLLPGLLLILGIFWCPESPRYYVKKDQWEKASKTLSYIRNLPEDHPYIRKELDDVRAQNLLLQPPSHVTNKTKYYAGRLFQKGTRNRIGLGLLLMVRFRPTLQRVLNFMLTHGFSASKTLLGSTSSHTTPRASSRRSV